MALNYQVLLKQNLQDLNPLFIGEAEFPYEEPALVDARSCSVLYYLSSGQCRVKIKGTVYPVSEGEFFLVPAGEATVITAVGNCPWSFRWVGFNGVLAYDFLHFPTVFSLDTSVTAQLCDLRGTYHNLSTRVASDLLLIHSNMSKPKADHTDHVQKVINHILSSYMFKIPIGELAKEMGVNHCHLTRQFTARMGCSIQNYLLQVRISNAKRYLNQGYSVKETALMCGFPDCSNFSKLFKKQIGLSPALWREQIQQRKVDDNTPYPPKYSYPLDTQI